MLDPELEPLPEALEPEPLPVSLPEALEPALDPLPLPEALEPWPDAGLPPAGLPEAGAEEGKASCGTASLAARIDAPEARPNRSPSPEVTPTACGTCPFAQAKVARADVLLSTFGADPLHVNTIACGGVYCSAACAATGSTRAATTASLNPFFIVFIA